MPVGRHRDRPVLELISLEPHDLRDPETGRDRRLKDRRLLAGVGENLLEILEGEIGRLVVLLYLNPRPLGALQRILVTPPMRTPNFMISGKTEILTRRVSGITVFR